MAGQRSVGSGDWVIQPETWRSQQTTTAGMFYVNNGSVLVTPLTVSGDWYNSAGDQMERFREMEFQEKAVQVRGDIWLHLVPRQGGTFLEMVNTTFSFLVILRITRWKSEADDQNDMLINLTYDMRRPQNANDIYVWQRMVTFTNVYEEGIWTGVNRIKPANLVYNIPVMAKFQRVLTGQDNMWLMVQFVPFHTTPAWDMATPYDSAINHRLVVTPYLRTYLI